MGILCSHFQTSRQTSDVLQPSWFDLHEERMIAASKNEEITGARLIGKDAISAYMCGSGPRSRESFIKLGLIPINYIYCDLQSSTYSQANLFFI